MMAEPSTASDAPTSPWPSFASSGNASDFVLLSTSSPHRNAVSAAPLPKPRFTPIMQFAALMDFVWTLLYAVPIASKVHSALRVPVAVSLCRPVLVGYTVSSARVRQRSAWILAQVMLSFLVLLWGVNELVQTYTLPPILWYPTSSTPQTRDSPRLGLLSLSRDPTLWYATSFGFSILHYLLYAIFVGVRRRRNPFVDRRNAGAHYAGEQKWSGIARTVRASSVTDNERTRLLEAERIDDVGSDSDRDTDHDSCSSEEEDGEDEEEDENEIVDIPKHSLRCRKSTASFFLDDEGHMRAGPPVPIESPPRPRATSFRHYGSLGTW